MTSASSREDARCPLVVFCNASETAAVELRAQSCATIWDPATCELRLRLGPGASAPVGCLSPIETEESGVITWIAVGRDDGPLHLSVYAAFRDAERGVRFVPAWATDPDLRPFHLAWERSGALSQVWLPWNTAAQFAILEGAPPQQHGRGGSLLGPLLATWCATGARWSELGAAAPSSDSEDSAVL